MESTRGASPARRGAGSGAATSRFPLRHEADRGASYAVAEDWSVPSTTVADKELVMWRLDSGALVAKMRGELGVVETKGGAMDLPAGALFVGEGGSRAALRVYLVIVGALWSDAERAAGRAYRSASGFARPVALVPEGRRMGRDVVELELAIGEQLGAMSVGPRLAEIARELGVEDEIEPWRLVDPDVRLVFHAKSERVWLDGAPNAHGTERLRDAARAGASVRRERPGRKTSSARCRQRPRRRGQSCGDEDVRWVEASFAAMPERRRRPTRAR